jgi:ubiquinone/menaquinone biosynthesis C-methylase UbiE
MDINQRTYSSAKIVNLYASEPDLQKPEATILKILENDLYNKRMLDIGVGAGRTTAHFVNRVKEYVGVDYSEGMIKVCLERFKDTKNARFEVMDMTKGLKDLPDNSFDFVLISFNSIDHLTFDERTDVLKQVRRILTKDNPFCFSTHNINFIKYPPAFKFKDLFSPYSFVKTTYLNALSLKNRRKLRAENSTNIVVNDGAHTFGLNLMYVDLVEQVKNLEKAGFKDIRVFSETGPEITSQEALINSRDMSVYYLCN